MRLGGGGGSPPPPIFFLGRWATGMGGGGGGPPPAPPPQFSFSSFGPQLRGGLGPSPGSATVNVLPSYWYNV